jgi:integrase
MAKALTVKRIQRLLKVPGKYTDGGAEGVKGLMLTVERPGSAAWSLRWQRDHKVRQMGLGSAIKGRPSYLSLAEARDKAREHYRGLADGVDPLERKRSEAAARIAAQAKAVTFKQAAERYFEAHQKSWTNARHAAEFLSSLSRWAYPFIGSLDVGDIDMTLVLRVLEQPLPRNAGTFWHKHVVTADRVRSRVERTLDFSTVRGWRSGDNPARWKGYLSEALPAPRKVSPVKHHAAVPFEDMAALMAALAPDQSVAAQALRFIILTAGRLSEVIEVPAVGEIDFEAAEWRIPAPRMKGRKPHTVPLSPQAIDLLKSLPTEQDNPFVFIGASLGTHVAESAVTEALRRAGRRETLHGLRSSFRTWAAERTTFPRELAEKALAHLVGDETERAYQRGELLEKRRRLMEAWAKYCCTPPVAQQKGEVVALRA